MRIGLFIALGCAAMLSSCAAAPSEPLALQLASPAAAVAELLAADRRFAAASGQASGVEAMTAMFADDAVMTGRPVPGFGQGRQEIAGRLVKTIGTSSGNTSWAPVLGGISADGQHGFTFGYMTTSEAGQEPKLAKYLSYWTRRDDGWRVQLFKYLPREAGPVSTAIMPPAIPNRIVPVSTDAAAIARFRESLASTERAFSDDAQTIGLDRGFVKYGSPDAVNGNTGREFTVSAAAIGAAHPSGPSDLSWAPDEGVLVASSGDLGVTWGYLRPKPPIAPGRLSQIPFFTIWRRDSPADPWLYVAE